MSAKADDTQPEARLPSVLAAIDPALAHCGATLPVVHSAEQTADGGRPILKLPGRLRHQLTGDELPRLAVPERGADQPRQDQQAVRPGP